MQDANHGSSDIVSSVRASIRLLMLMDNEAQRRLRCAGISHGLDLGAVHEIWKGNNINFLVLLSTRTSHERRRDLSSKTATVLLLLQYTNLPFIVKSHIVAIGT